MVGEAMKEDAAAAKERMGDAAQSAKERAGEMAEGMKEKASDAAHSAKVRGCTAASHSAAPVQLPAQVPLRCSPCPQPTYVAPACLPTSLCRMAPRMQWSGPRQRPRKWPTRLPTRWGRTCKQKLKDSRAPAPRRWTITAPAAPACFPNPTPSDTAHAVCPRPHHPGGGGHREDAALSPGAPLNLPQEDRGSGPCPCESSCIGMSWRCPLSSRCTRCALVSSSPLFSYDTCTCSLQAWLSAFISCVPRRTCVAFMPAATELGAPPMMRLHSASCPSVSVWLPTFRAGPRCTSQLSSPPLALLSYPQPAAARQCVT